MTQHTVKTGIKDLPSPDLLQKGRNVVDMLTGNPGYPELQAELPAFSAICDALELANNTVLFNGGKLAHEAKRLAVLALRNALRGMAAYVQGYSKGDKALILSAGFDVVKPRTVLPAPDAPKELRVRRTVEQGILKVKWSRVHGTKLSYLEMIEQGAAAWQCVATTTRSSHVMTNLNTGKEYSFRVQAITSGGTSPMSEVVTNIAA